MKALNGKGQTRPDPRGREAQRKGLLAKVHIAKKDLGFEDYVYREILDIRYDTETAEVLSIAQLEDLVGYFQHLGWKPKRRTTGSRRRPKLQTEVLRERAWAIVAELENGDKRLQGLVAKICGTQRIEWCHDVRELKQVVAVLQNITGREK